MEKNGEKPFITVACLEMFLFMIYLIVFREHFK